MKTEVFVTYDNLESFLNFVGGGYNKETKSYYPPRNTLMELNWFKEGIQIILIKNIL